MKRLLIAAAALLAAPGTASAATVHVGPAHRLDYPNVSYAYSAESYSFVYYDAAPGEQNRLTIDYKAGSNGVATVTLTDPGAVIEPGNRCTSLGPHQARCQNTVGVGHYIEATGAARRRRRRGALARPGERLGGRHHGRTRGVTVDLSDGTGGETSEGDVVRNVELAQGGAGDDRLLGTGQPTDLYGGRGGDLLAGRRGLDRLHGGPGRDDLRGDEGPDFLYPGPDRDRVSCGAGDDDVIGPQKGEDLRGPCELAFWTFSTSGGDFPEIGLPPNPVAVRRRTVDFQLECPRFDDDGESLGTGCSGRLVVRAAHHRVASADVELRSGTPRSVRVHLNRRGRRLVRRKRGFVATMTLDFESVPKVSWTVRVRR